MSAALQFRLFGPFAVGHQGGWHHGPPLKKGRELIQYLAVYPRGVVTFDELAAAFWPRCDGDEVRHRIHLAASGARMFLRTLLHGADVLRCIGSGYAWSPAVLIDSDIERFIASTRLGTRDGFREALDLYGGEFLAGETAEWMQPMRVRLSTAHAAALHALASEALELRDHARALSFGLELVDVEPGHESATRLVMTCFAALGLRVRVLEQYSTLKAYLAEHIGVEPTQETTDLACRFLGVTRASDQGAAGSISSSKASAIRRSPSVA